MIRKSFIKTIMDCTESKICHVFVYGTLKKGEPNHHWLTDSTNGEAEFICNALTTDKFPLVIASRYNIPYLVNASGQGMEVEGEVYKVNNKMLMNLDVLENHPKYYKREIKDMKNTDSNTDQAIISSWVYLLHSYKPAMLQLPFLTSYKSKGDHGKQYIARYLRETPGSEYWKDVMQE